MYLQCLILKEAKLHLCDLETSQGPKRGARRSKQCPPVALWTGNEEADQSRAQKAASDSNWKGGAGTFNTRKHLPLLFWKTEYSVCVHFYRFKNNKSSKDVQKPHRWIRFLKQVPVSVLQVLVLLEAAGLRPGAAGGWLLLSLVVKALLCHHSDRFRNIEAVC